MSVRTTGHPELSARHLLQEAGSRVPQEEGLFRGLVESVTEYAIFALDPEGHIVTWNAGAERTTGYRAEEALGKHLSILHPPRGIEGGSPGPELRQAVEEGRSAEEGWRVRKDGTQFWAGVSLSPLRDAEGRLAGFATVMRDLTGRTPRVDVTGGMAVSEDVGERRRMEEALRRQHGFLALLQEVAVAANGAASVEAAFETALARICAQTAWPAGHALLRDPAGDLVCTGLFHVAEPERSEEFRRLTAATRFAPGVGLPGRVLVTGRPAWTGDTEEEAGLRPGLAIPVRIGTDVVGALEFFSDRAVEPDDALLDVMDHVGTQLGRVVERERAVDALREGEERFRLMFERNPLPTWVVDQETLRFLDVNEAAVRRYGYSREELLSMTLRDLRSAEEFREGEPGLTPGHGRAVHRGPSRHRKRDGTTIDVEVTSQGIALAGREVRLVVALDVTERRRAEERQRFLLEAGQLLASASDYEERIASFARLCVPRLADMCLVDIVEEDGEIRRVGVAHRDPEHEKVALGLLAHPPSLERPDGASKVLRTGRPVVSAEVTAPMLEEIARDAEHLRLLRQLGPSSFMTLPLIARGRTLGAVTFAATGSGRRGYGEDDLAEARDLAARAALLLDNARLYRRAQQARRAREDVLAVVSHELRNPLTATLALVEILLEGLPPEAWRVGQRRHLESIRGSAEQMARLVDDLLDITRIEAGLLTLRRHPEEVAPLVEAAVEMLRPLAARKSIRLQGELPEGLPEIVADRQRVHQVLSNLVANAVDATPEGGAITVRVEACENGVRFSVSDTGPGIAQEHLPHLFDRYWRGSRRTGQGLGLGLGLAIARGIVEAHGGRIRVESSADTGTTFTFDVPAVDETTAPAGGPESEDPAGARLVATSSAHERAGRSRDADFPEQTARQQADAAERRARFLAGISGSGGSASRESPLADQLRERIMIAVHTGRLRPGDRLPSVREVSREFGVTNHAVVQAYATLGAEGLVHRRERSGIFVGWPGDAGGELPGETANWVAGLLAEACEHQIKIPLLSDLIRRSTATVRLRCACVESDEDHLTALCAETGQQFGLRSYPVSVHDLPPHQPGTGVDPDDLPAALREADLIVTSIFHASRLRLLTEELGKPLIVGTVHPHVMAAIEQRLHGGPLTVVCADERFAERLRASFESPQRDRIRVVTAGDSHGMARLDPSDPVFCTRAAYGQVSDRRLRLLVPLSPFLSPQCARDLVKIVIRLNMEAERPYTRARGARESGA